MPENVFHRILESVSFPDYVHLMCTCKEAYSAMDNENTYKVVWNTHFDRIVKSYRYPVHNTMAANPWRDVNFKIKEILRHIRKLRKEYLAEYRSGRYINVDLLKKAEGAMKSIVEDSGFFVPLIFLSTVYWDQFCQATIDRVPYDMFMMCITKNLLYMLNVHIAHKYFKNLRSGTRDGVEVLKCLFEISRLDFGFPDLAAKRLDVFEKVSRTQLDGITRRDGYLIFQTQKAFCDFVTKTCDSVLSHLPLCDYDNGGRNILREFSHPTGQTQLFTLALLADYLSEALFKKFKFDIDYSREELLNIEIGSDVLCIGALRFKLAQDLRKVYHTEESAEITPLSYKSAIEICKSTTTSRRIDLVTVPPMSERFTFWTDKYDYILKLHEGGEAENLTNFVGANKLWELDYSYSLTHAKKSYLHLVCSRRPNVVQQEESKWLSLTVGWRDDSNRPLVHGDNGRVLYITKSSSSFKIASPEKAQQLMKCRGFNFMGIKCVSQIEFSNDEYIFTELTKKTLHMRKWC